ncbi:hypothetical protein Tco_0074621, partial [Tanacetum coccineum]
ATVQLALEGDKLAVFPLFVVLETRCFGTIVVGACTVNGVTRITWSTMDATRAANSDWPTALASVFANQMN